MDRKQKALTFIKEKKLDFSAVKIFCSSKDTIKKMNKLSTDKEIAKYGFIARGKQNCFVSFFKKMIIRQFA